MSTTTFPVFPRWHTQLASLAALLAVIVGDMALAGWVFDIGVLKSILPGWVSMKPNAAVSFILIGIALLLTTRSPATFDLQHSTFFSRLARVFGLLAGLLAGLIGLLTLSEYVFGWDFGIDQWLIREPTGMVGTSHPGRMAPETALCFVLLAAALWIASGSRRLRRSMLTSMILGLLVTTLALASILSYVMPASSAYGWFGLTFMAMHTAITFTVLGAAVIAISWQQHVLQWSLSRNTTAAFICGMAVLVFIGLNTNRGQFRLDEMSQRIGHSKQLQIDSENILHGAIDAHVNASSYTITGDERFRAIYLEAVAQSNTRLDSLHRDELAASEPEHQEHFARIEAQTKALFQLAQQIMDAPRTGMAEVSRINMIGHGEELLDNLHKTIGQVESEHQQRIQQWKRESENLARSSYITVAAGTLASLLIFLTVIFRLNFTVNEWKRAEQEIIGSEEKFHMLFDSIADAIFIYEAGRNFIQVNQSACERMGYSREEFLQMRPADIDTPEYAAKVPERIKVLQERGELVFESAHARKDGSVIPVELSTRVIDYAGKPAILCVARDITERKRAEDKLAESERHFRAVTQSANDAIITSADAGIIVRWNAAAERLFGYTEAEIIGQPLTVLMPERFRSLHRASLARVVAGGPPHLIGKTVEVAGLRKDSSEFPLEISLAQWQAADGQFFTAIIRDITERKQAEQALSDSESRLKSIVENSSDWIWEVDENAVYTYASPQLRDMLGYEVAEVIGKTPFDLMPPEEAKRVADIFGPIAAARKSFTNLENTNLRKDGHPVVLETSGVPVIDPKGKFCGYRGIDRDITGRKRAEMSLRDSEARLQTIVENLTEGIAVSDLDGRLLHFNRAALDLHGFATLEECHLHLTRFADLFELSAMDGTVWPVEQWPLSRILRGEELRNLEVRVRHIHAGWQKIFNYGGMLVREADGQPLMAVVTISDITGSKRMEKALRESEAHYRRITEGITDYRYTVRIENGRAVETTQSPACITVTGYSAREFAANPYLWIQMVVPEDRERVMAHVQQILAGQDVPPIEHRITRKNGEICWISDTTILFKDASGKLLSYDGVIKDITERKSAEAALRQLNEELENKVVARTADLDKARHDAEAANRAKSAFLASMSHEIRTPMNGVIGMLDVLQQSSLKGAQVEMVNIIYDSAFALLTIIDDILDFSKIEASKLQIGSEPMDVAEVVEGVCKTLDRMALKKRVEMTLFTDPAIPASVMGDAGRLRQILINLVNNAIKFSSGQERQGRVSVRALLVKNTAGKHGRFPLPNPPQEIPSPQSSPASGRGGERENQLSISESLRDVKQILLEFRVTDNGIGIDKATLTRLFTPFTQADTSTTRTFGGTGLGLAISRQLANLMGGEIAVHSEPGQGALFSVRIFFALPAEQPAGDEAPSLIAGLSCLVVDGPDGIGDDLAAYLVHDKALADRTTDLAAAGRWIANRPAGLCVVVIDTVAAHPPLDDLRAAAAARPGVDARFVVIGRGGRRRCRLEAPGLVALDAEAMHRRALLEAVAIAAGRADASDLKEMRGDVKVTLTPLSREEARRRGRLILVVEDNEINQKVIQQQLALLGHTADIANNGREALERWQSGDYGLLITDLHMPDMDGYEMTTTIRAAENGKAHIPIIAYTANATKGEAEHCIAIGMDDYLSKPVQLVNLKAMLEKWLPVQPVPVGVTSTQSLPPARGKARMGVEQVEQQESRVSTPSLTLPLQGGGNIAVDVNVLKKLVGDDEATLRDFLHDFRISAAKTAVELRAACAAGQSAAAGALAHKLKSSSRSVGALALGELCSAMEKSGKMGDSEALTVLLPMFEQELASVEGFLEKY